MLRSRRRIWRKRTGIDIEIGGSTRRLCLGHCATAYDRAAARRGVVHLGIGAFHRAHQRSISNSFGGGDLRWAITAYSLRSAASRSDAGTAGQVYSVLIRDGDDEDVDYRRGAWGAGRRRGPGAVVAALADAVTRLVTLTITGGLWLDRAAGHLLIDDPDIAATWQRLRRRAPRSDSSSRRSPRRDTGLPPFTAL